MTGSGSGSATRASRQNGDTAHWARLLGRGLTKRCPRCGAGHLYRGWFRMVERCPGCGLKFEREPGFFVGAYLINFATSIILLFALCMGFVGVKAANVDADATPFLVVGVLIGLAAPVFCYPFARTVWSAIDIGMTPLEAAEEADADAHAPATGARPPR